MCADRCGVCGGDCFRADHGSGGGDGRPGAAGAGTVAERFAKPGSAAGADTEQHAGREAGGSGFAGRSRERFRGTGLRGIRQQLEIRPWSADRRGTGSAVQQHDEKISCGEQIHQKGHRRQQAPGQDQLGQGKGCGH